MEAKFVTSDTPTKRRLIRSIKSKVSLISDQEIEKSLNSIRKFTEVCQSIISEPQWRTKYIEQKTKDKIEKKKIIYTDLDEIKKMQDKNSPKESSIDHIRKFYKFATKHNEKK